MNNFVRDDINTYVNLPFANLTKEELVEILFPKRDRYNLDIMGAHDLRHRFVKKYSWSIPCREAINTIKQYSTSKRVLDVMAGSGFWVKLLIEAGVKAEASDINVGDKNTYKHTTTWVPIKECDGAAMVKKNQNADIIVAWPPYDEPDGTKIINEIKKPGTMLYYFGEGGWGCTGDNEFHEIINDQDKWHDVEHVQLPQWDGLHDSLMIYRRV